MRFVCFIFKADYRYILIIFNNHFLNIGCSTKGTHFCISKTTLNTFILLTFLRFYGNNGYASSAQYNVVVRCPNIFINCIKNAF